jgi:hypothetical protein
LQHSLQHNSRSSAEEQYANCTAAALRQQVVYLLQIGEQHVLRGQDAQQLSTLCSWATDLQGVWRQLLCILLAYAAINLTLVPGAYTHVQDDRQCTNVDACLGDKYVLGLT